MQVAELFARLHLAPDEASWDKGHELIEGLHHALEAYLGYEGLKKVKELVEGTVEAAVAAKHLGERLGITGEAVQELGYAADVTGASQEDMTAGLQRLAAGLEHAKKGTGPLVDAMSQLKIPISDLKKGNLEQNLEQIADGFEKAGPKVNKLALSIEIFGRNAGPKLLPLLNKGASGIAELREEAQKLGVVIDEEGIEKAEEFEIAQKKLGATLKGVRNEAVIAMLPALQEMTEGLSDWVKENREAIASTLTAILKGLAEVFHVIGTVIGVVVKVVQYLGENLDLLIPILAGVAAILLPLITEWAAGMLIAAGATIVAIAPFIAIAAAVAAVTFAIMKLIQHWDQVVSFLKSKGNEFVDWLEALPGRVVSWVEDVAQSIKDAFAEAWAFVVKEAHKAWNDIKEIPVIGHVIKGAGAVLGGPSVLDLAKQAQTAAAGVPSVPGGLPGSSAAAFAAGIQASYGDTNIEINAANMSPEELKGAVKDSVREAQADALRIAYANLSGGRR